jgi:hypothetical protein
MRSAIRSTSLLFPDALGEFPGHGLRTQALGHELMALIPQYADRFRGQRFMEYARHPFDIGPVGIGNRALFHVLARALTNRLEIRHKRLFGLRRRHGSVIAAWELGRYRAAAAAVRGSTNIRRRRASEDRWTL